MNMQLIQAAPVKKIIVVKATQARAFDVFTRNFDSWWPKSHHIGKAEMKEAVMEPKKGGRWYEKDVDGSVCDWGVVLVWEPPARLVVSWQINGKFVIDAAVDSEVEVKFIAESDGTTRVELEHRIRAADAGALREAVDAPAGWSSILDLFAKAAA